MGMKALPPRRLPGCVALLWSIAASAVVSVMTQALWLALVMTSFNFNPHNLKGTLSSFYRTEGQQVK